ncbi:MAG: UTP--glucose-1-phosphate uridylyltransferase [Spirochaetota bacterium]|jgi:UTP--glucose-1-phosphate uridylyltransferase|nr:UTP--glucose-1-phosphate uridylyltransferase [Spirochaetota bacterium]
MKGVIIAAGYGTRFLPASKTIPKELFPLVNKPAISFIVDEFIAAGIEELLIITSRRKKALDDYFDHEIELEEVFRREGKTRLLKTIEPAPLAVSFIRQQEMRGTGDAILLAEGFAAGQPVCVAYPDDIVLGAAPLAAQLAASARDDKDAVLGVMTVPRSETNRYGIIAPGDNGMVQSIIEKPAVEKTPSCLATIGRYVLPPAIFPILREEKKRHAGGEFFLTGAINILAEQGKARYTEFEGKRLDVGDTLGYIQATIEYALTMPELAKELADWIRTRVEKN